VVALEIANEFQVDRSSMDMMYMSPTPYYDAFDEVIDLRRFDLATHSMVGLSQLEKNGQLIIAHMSSGTPSAKIPRWHTWLCSAWLIKIEDHIVTSIDEARNAVAALSAARATSATLLFAHPEVRPDISHRGLSIVLSEPFSLLMHDQLNNQWEFSTVANHLRKDKTYELVESGDVLNIVMRVMRLTRGKLLKQLNWAEWQASEFLQLDQYNAQGMFGTPVLVDLEAAVSVWCGRMQ
jgi:hypothetical protein